jgi:hypothetical protein
LRRRYGVPAICMLVVIVLGLWLAPASAGSGEPLYVALIWHNHQPFYKNTATGMYMMPWVRMHAVKDYYDMVSILKDYPNVHATFNLVPSLILQLDEYVDGAQDIQLLLSLKPASELRAAILMMRRFGYRGRRRDSLTWRMRKASGKTRWCTPGCSDIQVAILKAVACSIRFG